MARGPLVMESIKKIKHDHYLSNASADTALDELARVVKAQHRVADSLKRAKR